MTTNVNEVIEFLDIASKQGFLNDNTVFGRRTACNKFFEILDPEQKTVEYVKENLDVIKSRFSNLNKDVRGNTVDEYARRVHVALDDFMQWKADRSGWERSVSARQSARQTNDGENKPRAVKPQRATPNQSNSSTSAPQTNGSTNPEARTVTFPIRPDFEIQVSLPRNGLTIRELKKLMYFLLPYASDWEPSDSPRSVFPTLEHDDNASMQ